MRLTLTLSLALVVAATLRAEAPPVTGTLPEDYIPELKPLLKTAVERSPNTIMAAIAVAQQEATKMAQYAILWPSMNLNSAYQGTRESESHIAPSTSTGLVYSANVSQPVFQWGAYKNQAAMGDLGVKIAEKQYAEAYRQLALSIRNQYLMLISKKIALRNAQFAQKINQEAMDAAQVKFDSGSISQAEVMGYKTNLEQAQLASDRAQADYDYTKRMFTRLVGIDDLADDSVPIMIPHPEYSKAVADAVLVGFVGNGIESTFQSQVYELSIKQQDLTYKVAKVRLLPKFTANATYSYSNYTSVSSNTISQLGVTSEAYSLGANWPIFDGFATRSAKLSALEAKRLLEREKKSYVDSTIDTITYMRHQVDFSARSMSFSEVHNALIGAEVKRFNDDQKLGYGSQATIDAGMQTLYATEFEMAYARADYLNQWTSFISLAGLDPALENISPRYVR